MYADDLAYVKPIPGSKDTEAAQEDLRTIKLNYCGLGLTLNAKKTKLLPMCLQKSKADFHLNLDGDNIEEVQEVKYLGVHLDPKLSYANHVRRTSTKCKQATGALCRAIRKWTSRTTLEKIYRATIEPMALYAIEAWYPSQVGLQTTAERMRKFGAKLLANDFTADYKTLLAKLGWKPLNRLALERRATAAYRYSTRATSMPEGFVTLQSTQDVRRSSRLARPLTLATSTISTTAAFSSSSNTLRRIWNGLPDYIRQATTASQFKYSVKNSACYDELAAKEIIKKPEENL